jgi:HK97 family phage major capsid protein
MKEKKERLQKCLLDARTICEKCEKEAREFTAEERAQVDALLKEAAKLRDEIKQAEGDAAMVAAIKELGAGIEINRRPNAPEGPGTPQGRGQTIGERFINAPAYQTWFKGVAPNGKFPESMSGFNSPPILYNGLKELLGSGRKELITGMDPTSAGAFVQTDYTGIYEPLGRIPLNVLGLISRGTTTSDLVEFVRQTRQVQEAAPTPEANVKYPTGATGEIVGMKPQGRMNFEIEHAPVKTIAVYVGATRRALSDAAQIRGIIDQDLRDDLQEELENQVVNGNGIGENFVGIVNTAGVLVQPFAVDVLTTTRRAITSVQVTGRAKPTGWVFNPVDWEGVELTRDLAGRFYFAGPFAQGPRTLWGLPVVESQTLAAGTALLGDWRKARLWDREQASIYVTDSHSDWFIRNIIAILAELRAAFGLIRPSAFCQVALV